MSWQNKKETSFEIDLLPFISLLSVLISFLLLTAVWINIGTMDITQAFGPQKQADEEKSPSVQISMLNQEQYEIELKDLGEGRDKKFRIEGPKNSAAKMQFEYHLSKIGENFPEVKTALIAPLKNTSYEDLIFIMDAVKKAKIKSIGIMPL